MSSATSGAGQQSYYQPQTPLTSTNLAQVPFTSNMTHYQRQDQGFEKRAQGIPAPPPDASRTITVWNQKWHAAGGDGTTSN
ncbi:uncharacterized protein BCR38DRAFT_419045 [Pseudomassariella vexata]|uniref:Uncharacterized protein n=1 Tax=Pseudomassariella vexata TaxID=1141098 RepID=A0A1Y2EKS3_9PEZI|nr:uncharacterized protein BCR38DRAFT_419045 [Pseudomassariella vexata]ORY72147.1 hypothetical protein BCR38DRAFT_419045 [Pseudomassariella vexata]